MTTYQIGQLLVGFGISLLAIDVLWAVAYYVYLRNRK